MFIPYFFLFPPNFRGQKLSTWLKQSANQQFIFLRRNFIQAFYLQDFDRFRRAEFFGYRLAFHLMQRTRRLEEKNQRKEGMNQILKDRLSYAPKRRTTTKYLYIKSTTVHVPSSELGLSHPFSRQRVCPSPRFKGGGARSPAGGGWGSPNSDDWRKSLAVCLLCEDNGHLCRNF